MLVYTLQAKTVDLHQAAPDCCFSIGKVSTMRLFEHDITVVMLGLLCRSRGIESYQH